MVYNAVWGIFQLYYLVLVARCILSFFPDNSDIKNSEITFWIYRLTDPILLPFQKIIPPIRMGMGYIDISPIVVFLLYGWVVRVVLTMIPQY